MVSGHEELQLKPIEMPELPASIRVTAEGLSLGRHASNAVVLPPERFPHVSSYHARIHADGDAIVVEDLGSKNGTLVNGAERTSARLYAGDVLQLGRKVGPRFIVTSSDPTRGTVSVATPDSLDEAPPPGTATVVRLKKALGIPADHEAVHHAVRRQSQHIVAVVVGLVLVSLTIGLILFYIHQRRETEVAILTRLNRELASRIEDTNTAMSQQLELWAAQKQQLEAERAALLGKLERLEENELASGAERSRLRAELSQTTDKLERIQPLSLEQLEDERRRILKDRLRAVLYIEKTLFFNDAETGKRLYVTAEDEGEPNFEGRGEPLEEEGGGSGFCISKDGWIVTNAHVVAAPNAEKIASLEVLQLKPEMKLAAIFSGTDRRHDVEVIRTIEEDDNDLAILKIEPFEDMPYLEELRLDVGLPPPGTQLRLLGFPFGKSIPQEGDTVTASVFAGVASRKAGAYLQVNAAVYPGNSGGPVVDPLGRVVGIVTSVQTLPSGQISEIGYVLPVERLGSIWPIK